MEIIISCTSLDETPQPHIHNLCTEQEEMNLSMARCVCVYVAMGVSVFNIEFVSAFWGPWATAITHLMLTTVRLDPVC